MAENRRLPLIGVIGGEDPTGCARLVGRELAKHECVVLTGGNACHGEDKTKNAALKGTLDAEQHAEGTARYIGVLPDSVGGQLSFELISKTQLLIHTKLSSMGRDPINGATPDILICFAGGSGTICELAFGIAVGREAIFHGHTAQLLLDKCTQGSSKRRNMRRNINQLARNWESHLHMKHRTDTDQNIFDQVTTYLRQAISRPALWTAAELVQNALQKLPMTLAKEPKFPGIPGSDSQKQIQEFTSLWKTLCSSS